MNKTSIFLIGQDDKILTDCKGENNQSQQLAKATTTDDCVILHNTREQNMLSLFLTFIKTVNTITTTIEELATGMSLARGTRFALHKVYFLRHDFHMPCSIILYRSYSSESCYLLPLYSEASFMRRIINYLILFKIIT